MKRLVLIVALSLSCGHVQSAPSSACADVCKHVADMKCDWADRCVDNCPTVTPYVRDCVAGALSCEAADRCDE